MIEKVIKRDGTIAEFNREKIIKAVFKAGYSTHSFGKEVAELITNIVVTEIEHEHDGTPVSIEVFQNKIEQILMRKGFYETAKAFIIYREKRRELRELKTHITPELLEEYLSQGTWEIHENANIDYSIQGLKAYVAGKAEEIYWLEKVYPKKASELHKDGWIHIHNLSFLGAYTYYGKEVVIAKFNGKLLVSPFEKLYELINEKEEILNERDAAFAKYPKDLYVLDKNGWTKAKRIVRKKKDRDMYFIKNRGGRSVIVTDNHPMITEVGEKEAYKVGENDKTFTVDLKKSLSSEKLFEQDSINILEEIKKRGWTYDDNVYVNGVKIDELEDEEKYQEGFIHTLSSIAPVRIKLTEKFGYFIGFTLAEGYLSYDDSEPRCVSLTQKDKALLMKANEGLIENGMSGCINKRDGRFELRVRNVFLRFLFENIFGITPGSKDKTLPLEILIYNKDFAKGVIAGLLDGDGTIETSNTTLSLRIVSRGMLEQLAVVMDLLGFVPQDRDIEGQGNKRFFNEKELIQNFPMYGVSFRKITEDLPSQKYRKAQLSTKAWQDEEKDEWHKVINNKKVNIPEEYIYDITTESGTLVVNGMWNHNCVGWDLEDLIKRGFGGVPGKPYSSPAKHLSAILGQMMNFLFTLQNEAAGAVAFSSFDTLLAPFVRYDKLPYKEVKQQIQEFVYNMNQTMRTGGQSPFSNITLDISPNSLLRNKNVVIGGTEQSEKYGDFQEEMNLINRAFWETMIEGDGHGRPFTFPIPTLNVDKNFPWDSKELEPAWEATAKFGIPYFANFINSDLSPDDARSMCCRLKLDIRELKNKGGGLFGANPLTGSVGVITINLPRIGYLSKDEEDFFNTLAEIMDSSKDALESKRKTVEQFTDMGLYPYSKIYLDSVKKTTGNYWDNHFSTIGIIGMNEALANFIGENMTTPQGIDFAIKIMNFMRERLTKYQEETGHMFNLEATPAESTAYSLALKDRKEYPDIITAGTNDNPYYTNSTQLPVGYTDDPFEAASLQNEVQSLYTGGTVLHFFIGERLTSGAYAKLFVNKIIENFKLPYITITPTFSICPKHGYIAGEHEFCPFCDEELANNVKRREAEESETPKFIINM
jgi:ribonucleoside-triphosphate reductase